LSSFTVQTLDSRLLTVTPTEYVTPQSELRIKGEGMARHETGDIVMDTYNILKDEQGRGDLVIKFNIVFPKKILSHHREAMVEALQMN
jgi:DnaJ-class molecular chaperone